MRKIITAAAALFLAGALQAARNIPLAPIADEVGIAYSKNFDFNFDAAGIDTLSVQEVHSSDTFTSATFQDGRVSTGTITVSTNSLSTLKGAQATNTLTVSSNALGKTQATNTIFLSSTTNATKSTFYGASVTVNGASFYMPRNWAVLDVASNTLTGIASAINAGGGFTAAVTTFTVAGATLTITANAYGTQGNAYTLATSTPTALVVGSDTFSGGQENATFTLNSRTFTAGVDFAVADVSSNTAVNIKSLINSKFSEVTASTTAATVVTITAVSKGTDGNAYTLTEVGGLTAGAGTFSGGVIPAYVTINGVSLVEGVAWTAVLTSTGNAQAISDAIMANSTLNAVIQSTWSSTLVGVSTIGVVNATTTVVGKASAYPVFSFPRTVIPWSNGNLQGGADADWAINTKNIHAASHGFTLGLPVLFSTGAIAIGGLTNQTTYYAAPIDANTVALALTSTGAVAGSYITLTSSSTTGPHTYTLAPLAMTGTASFKWQASNDGNNFVDLSVSSVTFASPYTAATTIWDFGTFNYTWLRLKYTAGTAGAVNLEVTPNGRRQFYLP